MENLVVYSNNTCPNCDNLKKALTSQGIPYQEVNLSEQPEHLGLIREKGFRQLPVINNNGDWMTGFTQNNFGKILQSRPQTA